MARRLTREGVGTDLKSRLGNRRAQPSLFLLSRPYKDNFEDELTLRRAIGLMNSIACRTCDETWETNRATVLHIVWDRLKKNGAEKN